MERVEGRYRAGWEGRGWRNWVLKILEKQDIKTSHILQAALGSKLAGESQTYTEAGYGLDTKWYKDAAKYDCSQSSHMQDSEKKKCQHYWCQGPQAKPPEASKLFAFYSSYQG